MDDKNQYRSLVVDRDAFPSNKKEEREKPKQVVQADVKKPSVRNRLMSAIFAGDFASLKEKLIFDVMAPMARDFIAGGLHNAINMAFYGKSDGRGSYTDYSKSGSGSRVSFYGSASRAAAMSQETPRDAEIERNLTFKTREDAYKVIDEMEDILDHYGQVTVADLCDICGVNADFTDNRYGWKSLKGAVVLKRSGAWVLDLPRTRVVD